MNRIPRNPTKPKVTVVTGACLAALVSIVGVWGWKHQHNQHLMLAKKVSMASPIRPAPNLPIPYVLSPKPGVEASVADLAAAPPTTSPPPEPRVASMPWDLCGVGELNLAEPKGDALARQFERDVAARESRALAMFAAANTEHPNPIGIEAQIFLRHFAAVMTDLRTEKRQLQGSDFDRAKAVVSVGELHKNRLSELVKTQPTATAHALLWAVCSREIGSPNESAACLSQSLSDWATLAPQSTSPHLAMLTAQVVRHPRQDPWPIMERITQAKIWQRIPIEPFSALWAAANFGGNGEANSPTYVAAQTYAVGVQLMQGIELYPGANATIAYQLCKEPDALTPSQRSLCSALALQLSTANTSLNDFAMAGSLGYHLKWPKSQIESAQAELQRHRQFSQRLLGNGSGFGCQSVKNGPGYFRSVLQNGEMATLRGQTPIKLNP